MSRHVVVGVALLTGCAWSNSLYQARLLSARAMEAEREHRPAEAQQLWGQVGVKADSAYARAPYGRRGTEALWLAGHAAVRTDDCSRAIPRLQGAMSAPPTAPWRQQVLLELAACEEPLGGPTAASLYTTLIASSTDSAIRRHARLRLGHTLVMREEWAAVLTALAADDTLPARLDRAMAFAGVGRPDLAIAELSRPLAASDTSVQWLGYVAALAGRNTASTDALLDRLLAFANVSAEVKSRWLLEGARSALPFDAAAADHRLERLAARPGGSAVAEGRLLQQQLTLVRSSTLPALRVAVDTLLHGDVSDDGFGARLVADLLRIARQLIVRNDATPPGAVAGDLTMFGLAELARDSLGSPRLGGWFFNRLEQDWPRSPFVAKALMARALAEPDSSADFVRRLQRLADNPYVAAANGNVAGMLRVTQLEDSLGRFVDRMWLGRPNR